MWWPKCIIAILSFALLTACSKKNFLIFDLNDEAVIMSDTLGRTNAISISNEEYILFSNTKHLNVHIHFCQPNNDAFSIEQAEKFAYDLLIAANRRWLENDKMNLPLHNKTVQLDAKIRLNIGSNKNQKGIVNHNFDSKHYFIKKGKKANRFDKKQMSELIVNKDSVISIFIMPFDPKEVRSGRQKIETTGIALGNHIKIAGVYESKLPAESFAGILNHEVGHILGLRHTWQSNDFCVDTPQNPNCWNYSDDEKCASEVSNNLMDYNAYQSAISPCQIFRMHKYLSTPGSIQSKLINNSFSIKDIPTVEYYANQIWDKPMRPAGSLVINDKASLILANFIQLPKESKIVVKKGGILVLYDAHLFTDSDGEWKGIVVEKGGRVYSDTYSKLQNVRIQ